MIKYSTEEIIDLINQQTSLMKELSNQSGENATVFGLVADAMKMVFVDKLLSYNDISMSEVLDFISEENDSPTVHLTDIYEVGGGAGMDSLIKFLTRYDEVSDCLPRDLYSKKEVFSFVYEELSSSNEGFKTLLQKLKEVEP